jgi:dodecin
MSIYKIIELVGTSNDSWEDAAKNAVETAGEKLKDLRIAEVIKFDMVVENNKVVKFRSRVNLSFKYQGE